MNYNLDQQYCEILTSVQKLMRLLMNEIYPLSF